MKYILSWLVMQVAFVVGVLKLFPAFVHFLPPGDAYVVMNWIGLLTIVQIVGSSFVFCCAVDTSDNLSGIHASIKDCKARLDRLKDRY